MWQCGGQDHGDVASRWVAGSRVRARTGEYLVVQVQDNGRGDADVAGHGLTLMDERVSSAGGELRITSPAGVGTTVRAVLPRRLRGGGSDAVR
jgi:glucose-6-phosphate-specific signal transduction histidine kinase